MKPEAIAADMTSCPRSNTPTPELFWPIMPFALRKVECSTSVAPFQFSGKFDLRCKKATLTGQNVSYMHHTQGLASCIVYIG